MNERKGKKKRGRGDGSEEMWDEWMKTEKEERE